MGILGRFGRFRNYEFGSGGEAGVESTDPSVEELPEEPQFGVRDNLAAKIAGMSAGELAEYRAYLEDMSIGDTTRYARGTLTGKGVLGGLPEEVKQRLLETVDNHIKGLEQLRQEQLDAIVGTSLFIKKFREEGYESIEEWIINMSPEELARAQHAYLAGKGSRSAEDVEQIREYLLEAADKLAEGIQGEKPGFKERLVSKLSRVKVFGRPLSEFAAGAVAGGAVRRGLRFAFMGVGGFIPAAIAGAGGGSIAALARGYFQERRAYKNLLKEMAGGEAKLDEISLGDIEARLNDWEEKMDAARHPRTVERLMDERRYLLMILRKKAAAEGEPPEPADVNLV